MKRSQRGSPGVKLVRLLSVIDWRCFQPGGACYDSQRIFRIALGGCGRNVACSSAGGQPVAQRKADRAWTDQDHGPEVRHRSEEHTSELQSLRHLVCRLLLEKK